MCIAFCFLLYTLWQSVHYKCDTCGKIADLLPELQSESGGSGGEESVDAKPLSKYAAQIAQLHMHSLESPAASSAAANSGGDSKVESERDRPDSPQTQNAAAPVSAEAATALSEPQDQMEPEETTPLQVEEPIVASAAQVAPATVSATTREPSSVDTFLHYLTVACVIALLALVYKKALKMQGVLQ